METTGPDKKGSILGVGFHIIDPSEPMLREAFCPQDAYLQEGFRADKFNDTMTNRQFLAPSSMSINNTDTSTREFLSSISASPITLSGLYCRSMEAGVKDMAPSIRANPAILSGSHTSEGVAKVAALNHSGTSNSHVSEMKVPGFNTPTSHIQRPWISQPQTHQLKNLERETSNQSSTRVARPPGEGRGKNQLLPRYWPRITDQELQLLTTKDSNCTITPLFEKVLSASDAGKIGRLVLPKACAEAYFPPISQAEGLPITVQDVSGNDWQFQFRFWPNNNSRMYVLEGITPCIQSMQLQAGDTVIFSRRDPEGKLLMGYRRASNISSVEETRMVNVGSSSIPALTQTPSRKLEKPSTLASTSGLSPQPLKTSVRAQVPLQKNNGQMAHPQAVDPGFGLSKGGVSGFTEPTEGSPHNLSVLSDKRKAKDINTKPKKPRCDTDSLEFKMNWEEAQNFLQSPPNVIPSIVTIEGYDFEEYEDPPVFGKLTVSSGGVPRKSNNTQQDVPKSSMEGSLQHITGASSDAATKQVLVEPREERGALSGLETLAYLATAEESLNAASSSAPATSVAISCSAGPAAVREVAAMPSSTTNVAASTSSPATTTKHPRHRPGCSCIVCIQPPSGKGPKHKPNCDCNVCTTVKRRFHTLMLRRKKLQSEKEAESSSQMNQQVVKEDMENVGGGSRPNDSSSYKNGSCHVGLVPQPWSKASVPRGVDAHANRAARAMNVAYAGPCILGNVKLEPDLVLASKGPQIDLNSQPEKEEEVGRGPRGLSMKSLLQNASYPLDVYLKQHSLTSLVCNEQLQCLLENGHGASFDNKKNDDPDEKRPVNTLKPDEQNSLIVKQ